jgi:predicted ATPase
MSRVMKQDWTHAAGGHSVPLVGRQAELEQINERLAQPECRLLTLVGVGGSGKTRLALEVAAQQEHSFAGGVVWAPLQAVDAESYLVSALADAAGISLTGMDEPFAQLIRYLRDKRLLLVLDNFEQLLDTTQLLVDILQAAPGVKILVTSREALKVQQEWLCHIAGLAFPASQVTGNLLDYAAVQLFVERARQARPAFSLVEEQAGVVRICQLVEGLPLALEIAASWTHMLRCAAIGAEIQSRLDFLRTHLRDLPDRHRSLQPVFDQTWQRLSAGLQHVFACVAVLRGSFDLEAAREIGGARLEDLAQLVDKCLLSVTTGRPLPPPLAAATVCRR